MEHPARFVVYGFLIAIAAGTGLLLLPIATAPGESTELIDAAFTSTSAVTVTGLISVDTVTHWTNFGKVVILLLVELGGLGFMTIGSLIVLLISKRLGLRQQLVARAERGSLRFGDVKTMLKSLAVVTFTMQGLITVILGLRFYFSYDYSPAKSLWYGVFHSITAFNNAGFSLFSDSLTTFQNDWVILVPVMIAIIVGGLGFPVLADLDRRVLRKTEHPMRTSARQRWDSLTLHTKVTLATTGVFLAVGFILLSAFEWGNPATLGPMSGAEKLLNGAFASVTPRTAGFNTVDVGSMQPQSLLLTMVFMFIGAGSAGTSGGIKVTTFAILALVIWSQLRGDRHVNGFRRQIPDSTQRQATTVALLAIAFVLGAVSVMLLSAHQEFDQALFEAISAFGTSGLSTGVTPDLPSTDQLVLMVLMLVGRVGPITLGAALVLRRSRTRYELPEEAPLIG